MNDPKTLAQQHDALSDGPRPYQIFRHYKGGLYVVISRSLDERTLEPTVTYHSNKNGTEWTRTLANFTEILSFADGTSQPRFKRVED